MNYPHANPYYLECLRVPFWGPCCFFCLLTIWLSHHNEYNHAICWWLKANRERTITCNHSVLTYAAYPNGLTCGKWNLTNQRAAFCTLVKTTLRITTRWVIHPCKWLKRKKNWEWLFKLVIPFVGRNRCKEWLEKQNKWPHGSLGMLYLGNQKCWYHLQSICYTTFEIRSAGVGPNSESRKLGSYNGNWGLPKTVYQHNWGHGPTPLSSKVAASQINDFTWTSHARWLNPDFHQWFCELWSQYV